MKNNYRLKVMCLLCMITAAFSSCKKSELAEEKSLTNNHNALAGFGRDGKNDLLGYGYNVLGEFGNASATTLPVIDVDKLQADQSNRVIWDLSTRTDGKLEAGSDAVSYLKKFTSRFSSTFGADFLGLSLFRTTITGSYNTTDNFSSKKIYSSYNLMVQQKRVKLNAQRDVLLSYLDSEFLSYIQNQTPEDIVNRYGTHILAEIILGGKLDVIYQSETSKSDRTVASSAGIDIHVKKIFNVSTGYTSDNNYVLENSSQKLHYVTNGGDPTRSLQGDIVIGNSSNPNPTPTINIAAWQNSCSLENSVLIDIPTNGLLPIYDFIPDQAKALAVKNYIIQYLNNNQAKLDPTIFYEYYNQVTNRHAYSSEPNQEQYWPNYYHNAEPFKVYATQYAGSVPLYQFYNPSFDNRVLTTNRYPGFSGYNYDGILCYVYQYPTMGTVPVYEFYSASGGHLYTTNRNASFPGWRYNGQPFHAFPN
ncbi:MAC/perforin domain-containing protein [Pedobacter jeongneungensis]|uniref:MAC/perforin domain-containing protein n=1 Tax=Pedobacter jeongneungensis TaxID=947309 RepID=UPI0004698A2D|nr:MAC/perforin domain-containing protein [Pedobacter jeongneungensis]